MKKTFAIIPLTCALALSACGSDDAQRDESPSSTTTVTVQKSSPTAPTSTATVTVTPSEDAPADPAAGNPAADAAADPAANVQWENYSNGTVSFDVPAGYAPMPGMAPMVFMNYEQLSAKGGWSFAEYGSTPVTVEELSFNASNMGYTDVQPAGPNRVHMFGQADGKVKMRVATAGNGGQGGFDVEYPVGMDDQYRAIALHIIQSYTDPSN